MINIKKVVNLCEPIVMIMKHVSTPPSFGGSEEIGEWLQRFLLLFYFLFFCFFLFFVYFFRF